MEEIKSSNTSISLIDEDIINGVENDVLLKDKIKNITLNKFSQKKIYHLLWHIFHSFSVVYPEEPTEEEQSRTKNFINKIATHLSIICYSCSRNKDTLIKTYDIDLAVSSRLNIIDFFCNYHKEVNIKYRPSIININAKYEPDLYTTDFIIKRYMNDDYISFIESNYNLNLYKLFQSNTMGSFFQLFYNFTKQFYRLEADKYDLQINLKISAI
jgi:hypothetical protein